MKKKFVKKKIHKKKIKLIFHLEYSDKHIITSSNQKESKH